MARASPQSAFVVCIIEDNEIAAQYLLQLLARDPAIRPVLPHDLRKPGGPELVEPIFVLDNWALTPPLSECLRKIRLRYPKALSLVLDKKGSDEDVVRMVGLGIHGFLAHGEVTRDLMSAVHAVSMGRLWLPPRVLPMYVRLTTRASRNDTLSSETTTAREAEIVELVKRRLSNKEIASILRIRESTVKFHLSNIFAKLQLTNRHDLLDEDDIPNAWAELFG